MLEIKKLRFNYGDKELFDHIESKIYNGEHVGLVGLNGSGKTTLMNLIAHRLTPDFGEIIWDKNTSYSYLDQHLKVFDDLTIREYLYHVYDDLFKKEDELNAMYQKLEHVDQSQYEKILNKCDYIQNELEENDFYMIKSKIGNVINGLGIIMDENHLLNNLSGGQRAKVFLGKMLLEEKDVLLLDEPTNFLDTHHVDWLSKYLINYKNAFIVISHNVDFLNDVANVILAIENKKLTKYKGNYNEYIKQRTMNLETYQKEYNKQQKMIKQTEDFINKNIVRATTTKRAQSRRKMLDKIERLEKPQVDRKVYFDFRFTKSFQVKPVVVKNLTIGYQEPILQAINLQMEFGKKYVIVGKNGIGKTTFLKTILGRIPKLGGEYKISSLNDIVYYQQEIEIKKETAIDFFRDLYPILEDKEIRSVLAKYGVVGENAIKTMDTLSGGEVAKVRFARLSLEKSNLLILDEPTNHLDVNAKKSLFKALAKYPGTVILVSHEKEFYQKLKMIEIKFE